MKIYYETKKTYVVAENKKELLDYLFNVDSLTENSVNYKASIATSKDKHSVLIVDISKYKTSVSFPLIIADGIDTGCITTHYDSLEIFRYYLKDFLDYIETLTCEKEKDYNTLLKKLTPKPTKTTKEKTNQKDNYVSDNDLICNRVEQYIGSDGMIYTKYIYEEQKW